MSLWTIGNLVLLLVVVPVLVALLNRVLAALEDIRGAAEVTLAGGLGIIEEVHHVTDRLAVTDEVIDEVANGAVRYAGSVGKLLG
ncbi:MAG TPA: hypothetical protein VLG28_18060 [Acidimicrobiia bacterium]|jgi:hypothetical protein|nr:hypothetical protein [Acidimicrobiia bacterium]